MKIQNCYRCFLVEQKHLIFLRRQHQLLQHKNYRELSKILWLF